MTLQIFQATIEHLNDVSKLFDQYREFYQQPTHLSAAKTFIQDRLRNGDSVIFLAQRDGQSVGFTQLYPSFSSVSMRPIWILNDLFVDEAYRQQGVARSLMNTAKTFAQETRAIRLTLATQITNQAAQMLYESLGYRKNEEFYTYELTLL
jgi:ribosomal protein S18 acetylase RimI-like enzyme